MLQRNFVVLETFQQTPVFQVSNPDRLEVQVANSISLQQSVDMLGALIGALSLEAPAPVTQPEIRPAKPRDLTPHNSYISAKLLKSVCSPARSQQRSQQRSQRQESTDMLMTPARSSSVSDQASASPNVIGRNSMSDQSPTNTDSPAPERSLTTIARTHLYQSNEEASKEKEKRRKSLRRTPQRKKHAPYSRANSYRWCRASGTDRAAPNKVSQDLLYVPPSCFKK